MQPLAIDSDTRRECFYQERDSRTLDYLKVDSPGYIPVTVHADGDTCSTRSGQLLLITLANQLARVHQNVRFSLATPNEPLLTSAVSNGSSLGSEIQNLLEHIDPYGSFDVAGAELVPAEISIGVGSRCRNDLRWYLGYDRSNAELSESPCFSGKDSTAALRGASLAAIIGAAAILKDALRFETTPNILSAWNFGAGERAKPGPDELPEIDIGKTLMIGGGAVGSGVVYWLMQWGSTNSWTVIDRDSVKLHNTNRCLLFFPEDAGWPDKEPKLKVNCLHQFLPNIIPIKSWYDEAPENKEHYDVVLVLANERDVRTTVSFRNDPIQFQATTGQSWLSQLHRHILGRDDCIRCRMSDVREPYLSCSTGEIETNSSQNRQDSALPFLSSASSLMLVSALQQLQIGEFGDSEINTWRWDFRSTHQIDSCGHNKCSNNCSTLLPSEYRRKFANKTRWLDAPWLQL